MSKGKYRKQLFKVFLLIFCLLNFIGVSLFAYFFTQSQDEQRISAIERSIDTEHTQLDLKMKVVMSQLFNLMNSDEVRRFSQSDEQTLYYNTLQLRDYLNNNVILIHDFDYHIGVVYEEGQDILVTNSGSWTLNEYLNDLGYGNATINEVRDSLNRKSDSYNDQYTIIKGSRVNGYFTYIISPEYTINNIGIILSVANTSLLAPENDHAFLWNESLGIIHHMDEVNTNLYKKIEANKVIALNTDAEEYALAESIEGYDTYIRKSRVMDWYSIYLYKKQNQFTPFLFLILLMIYAIFVATSILVAQGFTNKLYKPVANSLKAIEERITFGPDPKKGQYDEFQYITEETIRLKSVNNELLKKIDEHASVVEEKYLKDRLLGIKIHSAHEGRKYYDINSNWLVTLIEIIQPSTPLKDEDVVVIKNEIRVATLKLPTIRFINIDTYTCALVMEGNSDYNVQQVRQIIVETENNIQHHVRAYIGSYVKGIHHLNESYKKARSLMDYKYQYPELLVLSQQDVDKNSNERVHYSVATESHLIDTTLSGKEVAATIMEELLQLNLMNPNILVDQKEMFIVSLRGTINRIIEELQEENRLEIYNNTEEYTKINEERDYKTLYVAFIRLTKLIVKVVQMEKDEKRDIMIEDMLSFVYENYADDIMLEDLASHLNISAKYGSILFKRMTGSNFKDVLNQHRIHVAKELLMNQPDIKVLEVANKVGFNSANTFIRVFKKYEGISPGKYILKIMDNPL